MNLMTFEEFKNTSEYENFIKDNPTFGSLKIMAFTAYHAVPIENVEIVITKDFGNNKVVFFRGFTDSSGIIDNINLPAPPSGYSLKDFKISDYALYDLTAIKSDFESIKKYKIGVLGNIKSIQYVKMTPLVSLEANNGGSL